jgi:hypothetical protein
MQVQGDPFDIEMTGRVPPYHAVNSPHGKTQTLSYSSMPRIRNPDPVFWGYAPPSYVCTELQHNNALGLERRGKGGADPNGESPCWLLHCTLLVQYYRTQA